MDVRIRVLAGKNMKWKTTFTQTRLYFISAIILVLGLGSAIVIYLAAANASDSVLGYAPESSKMYLHDLELYGGKANLLADEILRWFTGLWHGESLAYTIGCITIFLSFGLIFVAYNFPFGLESDARSEKIEAKQD